MRCGAILVAACLAAAGPAAAEPIAHEGLVFSDELGGFRLVSVSGSGSRSDPFVVVEEVSGEGAAILTIEGWADKVTIPAGVGGSGFLLRKVAINASPGAWQAYELELREDPAVPSGYLDGLSFGQLLRSERVASSDLLPNAYLRDEPYDAVVFSGGEVPPGAAVTFEVMITDVTPVNRFYLVQRLRLVVSQWAPLAVARRLGETAGKAPPGEAR